MWYHRNISGKITDLAKYFPVIILTGARQTGKTSLLKRLFPQHRYVTLDVPQRAELAESSPEKFLNEYPAPLIVDEVQYAPQLFRHLKILIDQNRHGMGQYILTGSQKFTLMREVSDSLAGRCGILELETLAWSELDAQHSGQNTIGLIYRGGFPDLWRDKTMPANAFYDAYLSTYIERDVRQILNISSLRDFDRFMRLCATRSGQILEKSSLASDLGVSSKAINSWLSVLETSNQIVLLEPWFTNIGKRIIKSPKIYFCDTGLLCYLLGLSQEDLATSPYMGFIWETFIFSEMRKIIKAGQKNQKIWFYRDNQAKEIDFLVQEGNHIRLVECKLKEKPSASDAKVMQQMISYAKLKKFHEFNPVSAYIVCQTPVQFPLDEHTMAIPFQELRALFGL